MLAVGSIAPDIDALATDGKRFRLGEQEDKLCTVLYFFPKAFTPGCTKETRLFVQHHSELRLARAQLVGISTDNHDTQCRFAEELKADFPMIGDDGGEISRSYDVLWPLVGLARRVTYVVDRERRVAGVFHHEIKVGQHLADVSLFVDALVRKGIHG